MSSVAKNKEELIGAIKSTYSKLRPELEDIPKQKILQKTMEGQIKGSKMSIHNLVSYLLGWAELVLKWDRIYTTENRIPDLPETGYKMNDWGALAEKFYQDYEGQDYNKILKGLDTSVGEIVEMLENKSDKDLYGVDWYVTKSSGKGYSFGRMVALNTSSPYKNAYTRIRKWRKS